MKLEQLKPLLIEHSNVVRALFKAISAEDNEKSSYINASLQHLKKLNEMYTSFDPEMIPGGLSEKIDKAVGEIKAGELKAGRETLLEIGRDFDDFVHS